GIFARFLSSFTPGRSQEVRYLERRSCRAGDARPTGDDRPPIHPDDWFHVLSRRDASVGSQEVKPARETLTPRMNEVLESFDSIAHIFDEEFKNEIPRRLRQEIYDIIGSLVPVGGSIVDINCGTGIDAIELAQKGYAVCGIDLAPKMVDRA